MIDENEFFRQAALKICGHLEIEEGLRACIEYLSQHMPADGLYLERYEKALGAMRIVARASAEKGERMDLLIPLPKQVTTVMAQVEQVWRAGTLPSVLVINKPDEEPVTRHILEALGVPSSSALSLPLIIEGQIVGALALLAEGTDRFNEHHVQLYATLKEPFFVAMSNTLKHEEVVRLKDMLADDNRYLLDQLQHLSGDQIIGADFGLRDVMEMVHQVAPLDSPVLLSGETGTGKEVIANAIHTMSLRREGPFIKVNCGAIPDSLLDSELFGHEKGAFTGALSQKRGRFERAHGGTIFLDEIGELPLEAQVRLLRVLQEKEIERVGGMKPIQVDIRVIAATHRDLQAMIADGQFREDLYFRLNVFPITIPPLRERIGDISALVQHFIQKKSRDMKLIDIPTLAPGAIDVLMAYHWPGNVRELENAVERAIILSRGQALTFFDLQPSDSQHIQHVPAVSEDEPLNLDEAMSRHIRRVLAKTDGKIHGKGGAAELLGLHANTLRNRMNKLGIAYGRNRTVT